MKRINSTIVLFCCLAVLTFAAPTRKVMLTLSPNETIGWGEYVSNFRTSSYNYICILKNKATDKEILVWNGQRKLVADRIDIVHIDINDFNKCIYTYRIGNDRYIQLEDQKYGPYEWVRYNDWYPMQYSSGISDPHYINKYRFTFDLMGDSYIHDHDGTIYKKKEGRYEYDSPDKKHHLKVSEDRRMATIDGVNYIIPIPVGAKVDEYAPDICMFNDGTCYYVIRGRNEDGRWTFYAYYITPSEVRLLDPEIEYLDLDNLIVRPRSVKQNNDKYPNFWKLPWAYDEEKGSYIAYEFLLQDKSKQHTLMAKWNQNYVLVDGKKYGTQCPVDAFYDETTNTFAWITIENNQMVMYTYAL